MENSQIEDTGYDERYEDDLTAWEEEQVFQDEVLERNEREAELEQEMNERLSDFKYYHSQEI